MSSRSQLFIGRLPMDIREQDLEKVFEKYGRLLRCDVKYGMYGATGRRGAGRTGMAYAFIDYDDRRDAEDAVRYENGREIRGHSIVVEWARGSAYRSGGGGGGGGGGGRENYGRSSSYQTSEECYRCHRPGHWARDCPELDRDRYAPRYRSRSRSPRPRRNRRSMSRSRSRDRRRSNRDRSLSREKRPRRASPSRSRSATPVKSHSRSRSPVKRHSESNARTPSKSMSRSRSRSAGRSPLRSPEKFDEEDAGLGRDQNGSPSPRKSVSPTNDQYENESDHSPSRSRSR